MLHLLIESAHFLAERRKLEQLKSPMLLSAVSMIEAAYWLIAGNRFDQALVMLDNAIELVLKAELERVHPILIADTKGLGNFQTLKSLLKDAFLQHPAGKQISIPEFDIEHTIHFDAAFDRATELYPSLGAKWRTRLLPAKGDDPTALHALRNEIVHHGGDVAETGRYVEAIVEVALPFLEEFLGTITRDEAEPVRLSHLLMEWTYREVGVAKAVLADLRSNAMPPAAYVIAPLAHHIVWTYTRWPKPTDDQDTIVSHCWNDWDGFAERQKYPKGWDDSLIVEISCPICDSDTGEGYLPAKVLLESGPLDQKRLVPEGFLCYVCGLRINPSEKYLARHFVPPIPTDTAAAYLKDLGIE
jgi:hypothetical protein